MEIHDGATYLAQYTGMDYAQACETSRQLIEWTAACLKIGETPIAHAKTDTRHSDLTVQTQIIRLYSYEEVFQAYVSGWPLAAAVFDETGFPTLLRGLTLT